MFCEPASSVESRFATLGRMMCFLRMAVLILLFVALCGAASDPETLVLRPIASEYQHVSTKAGGEFSVKRQFTCSSTTIVANFLLLIKAY